MSDVLWLSVGLTAYAGSVTLTMWLRPFLVRHGAVTRPGPDNVGRAVPRGGGLAIVVLVMAISASLAGLASEYRSLLFGWGVPASAIAAVSLWDDFRTVPALARLVVHCASAGAVVWLAGPLDAISFGGSPGAALGILAWPLSLLWIVGMTNAFNFMDGIDGMAGLTAVIGGAILAAAAAANGCFGVEVVAVSLACASAGFLSWNWAPARIFMGDVGSTFCGFTIASMPLVAPPAERSALASVAMLAMWPFVFDTSFAVLMRIMHRENILEPHCGHIYQRLVMAGWSHARVATLYGGLAAATGGMAVAPLFLPGARAYWFVGAIGLAIAVPVALISAVALRSTGTTLPG